MLIRMLGGLSHWTESLDKERSHSTPEKPFVATGDAIAQLRSTQNTLSVWKADSEEDCNDAFVALALGRHDLEKISYCLLDEKELDEAGITISDTQPGEAPGAVNSILAKHRDLTEIDYWKLGDIAGAIKDYLRKPENPNRITIKSLKALLNSYKDSGKIDVDNMNQALRAKLNW